MKNGNRKVVIIGGPSSGKTTLIREFERRNFLVVHEIGRQVLSERKDKVPSTYEWEIRERLIYERQVEAERKLPKGKTVFLDRGTIDCVAYSRRLLGYLPIKIGPNNYSQVFSLERLPFVADGLRTERGDKEARDLHEEILRTYEEFGYAPTNVPIFDGKTIEEAVAKRADFILSKLEELSDD